MPKTDSKGSQKSAAAKKGSNLKKMKPTAKMPSTAVIAKLSPEERDTLETRLNEIAECIFHPSFRTKAAEAELSLNDDIQRPMATASIGNAAGSSPSLKAAEERELFLKFNYSRYRVMKLLRRYRSRPLTLKAARELLTWERKAAAMRDSIVHANLGLVPAMLKRAKISGFDFSDLIGDGYLALLRSIDRFDCSKGFKFSTYACRSILTSFMRHMSKTSRYRSLFPAEFDPELEKGDQSEQARAEEQEYISEELRGILSGNMADLSPVEQRVIRERFGFNKSLTPAKSSRMKTLAQIANRFGVTKERVRQIQNKALLKLRTALEDQALTT